MKRIFWIQYSLSPRERLHIPWLSTLMRHPLRMRVILIWCHPRIQIYCVHWGKKQNFSAVNFLLGSAFKKIKPINCLTGVSDKCCNKIAGPADGTERLNKLEWFHRAACVHIQSHSRLFPCMGELRTSKYFVMNIGSYFNGINQLRRAFAAVPALESFIFRDIRFHFYTTAFIVSLPTFLITSTQKQL
jgi:hypothetical protein